ncbi:putative ATP-dependent RNA helicase TDRD12 [Polypterus senegalus]|uniref:putative ATP-dependent RNA helicase TDRD12 n=1 Tax=Polypterus senegalus TaxID=55291 RepID=UPI0019644130|nr:putative ATP-dependent RNA helicase TDRD12 [Polypterus senegalus]
MFELQILKVQSPSNFWGRIVNGSEILAESSEYTKLHEAMNLFYHQVWKNGDKLKMESFEPGQVCIVYSKKIKSWCRAFIDSHHHESNGHHVMCFLLDYADYVIVEKKHIQAAIKKFMHLPYWAKKFRLAGLQPSRLTVDLYRDKAEMVPASQWDNAAVRYFQNLVQESSLTEAELYTTMNDYYIIYLYVLQGTEKICVNDDLATKGFACYTSSVLGSNPFLATQNVDWKYFCKHQEKWSAVEVLWPGALKRTENQTCRQDLPGCATSSKHLVDSCERKMVMARIKEQFDEEKSSSENQKKEPLQFNLRLLRFLDPYPAKDISLPEVSVLSDCNCNALIHSASKINACSHLDMSPIPENLKKILRKKKYKGPNFEESYTWPAIIRGCDVVAISHKGNDPMLFIPPLLRFLQYSSIYTSPSLHGPAAVILCPSWRKARHVFTLLEEFKSAESLSPMLLLFGLKTDKAEHLKILKECMVIVTTPNCLVRLLQFQCHRLVGYCHLILDEVDELFSQAFEQGSEHSNEY